MPERMLLVIRFEECTVPVYVVETDEMLCWWNIDQASLKKNINANWSRSQKLHIPYL
jgi:hypothetical protein